MLIKDEYKRLSDRYGTLIKDMFKYGLASVAAMALDMGSLYFFVEYILIHYMIATTISFCLGLVFHYILVKLFVFKTNKNKPIKEFVAYSLIGLIGLILNNAIIYILVWMNFWYIYAKLISIVVVFFFNFFERRKLLEE